MPIVKERSRGYTKLAGAARSFHFDFRGKVVLDIGSSTGGFTQYALDHGAKKVIAVEKGTNQMMKPLRFDPRIDLHEKTDIFDVSLMDAKTINISGHKGKISDFAAEGAERSDIIDRLSLREAPESFSFCISKPDIILADVSFVSLKAILKHARKHLASSHTDFLVMLKPQFEATPTQLNKGVVKNEKIRREIIKDFEQWLKRNNFIIINKRDNSLKGKTGNQERFYWLKRSK